MTFTSFESILHQHLTPFFERHGFMLLPGKKQYRRATSTGFQNVMLSTSAYADETILDISFGCRNDQIEQIAEQFLINQAVSSHNSNTIVVPISQFNDFQFVRSRIHTEDDLIHACEKIEHFFQITGFAFLMASGTIADVDRLFNEYPTQPCPYVYNQMHRFYKGLISARLNHNMNFDGLIDKYRPLLVNETQNPYEQIHFERLIAYLYHYSVN